MDNEMLESNEEKELPTDMPDSPENAEEPTEVTEVAEAVEKTDTIAASDESAQEIARYKTAAQAGYVTSITALVFTLIFYMGEYLFRHTANYALCATVLGALAVGRTVMFVRLKERRDLLLAILYGLVAVMATVLLFVDRAG